MIHDHDGSEGAIAEEALAWERTAKLFVFVVIAAVFFLAMSAVNGCASAAPDPAQVLHGNADIFRCQELGRAVYRNDGGSVAAFDTYYVCTQEAGLPR